MFQTTSVPSAMQSPPLLTTVLGCMNVCEHMTTMMLGTQDVHARRNQINLLRDCATICNTLACYLARESVFARMTASLCARICEVCGNACAQFGDQASQSCARICMHCAQECRTYGASAG